MVVALLDADAAAVVAAAPVALEAEPDEADEAADAVDETLAAQDAWVGTSTPYALQRLLASEMMAGLGQHKTATDEGNREPTHWFGRCYCSSWKHSKKAQK